MAITMIELVDSRERSTGGSRRTATLHYLITGTDDDEAAKTHLLDNAPETWNGLAREESSLEPVWVDEMASDGQWDCRVRYVAPENQRTTPETGESSWSFDTGGGTQHITQSITTVNSYAPSGETAPDFEGAIGVTHDSVEGVDITVPVFEWTETHYVADGDVSIGALFNATGKKNDAAWKDFAPGEVLFLGASGSKRGTGEDWEITYHFAASPHKASLTVGSITGIEKKGWDYLWVRYADEEDSGSNRMVKKPIAAYVEQVYEDVDFSGIGVGS